MRYGIVLSYRALHLYAEEVVYVEVLWKPYMNVCLLCRRSAEPLVVVRKIPFYEVIGFFFCLYALEPHLLYDPVLECAK